jgi:hypothetical protein
LANSRADQRSLNSLSDLRCNDSNSRSAWAHALVDNHLVTTSRATQLRATRDHLLLLPMPTEHLYLASICSLLYSKPESLVRHSAWAYELECRARVQTFLAIHDSLSHYVLEGCGYPTNRRRDEEAPYSACMLVFRLDFREGCDKVWLKEASSSICFCGQPSTSREVLLPVQLLVVIRRLIRISH